MADSDESVDELLAAVYAAERTLAARRGRLAREPGWSEVTFELRATAWRSSEAPDAERWLGFSGYVDGEYEGVGGLAWIIDLIREGRWWKIERGLHLNRNTATYQETVAELPTVRYSDSSELASKLPDVLEELLRLPAPSPK